MKKKYNTSTAEEIPWKQEAHLAGRERATMLLGQTHNKKQKMKVARPARHENARSRPVGAADEEK